MKKNKIGKQKLKKYAKSNSLAVSRFKKIQYWGQTGRHTQHSHPSIHTYNPYIHIHTHTYICTRATLLSLVPFDPSSVAWTREHGGWQKVVGAGRGRTNHLAR